MLDFFFFNATATTEIYTLSLHDALPILCEIHAQERRKSWSTWDRGGGGSSGLFGGGGGGGGSRFGRGRGSTERDEQPTRKDRESTRLKSSHANISDALFCLKKKNTTIKQ